MGATSAGRGVREAAYILVYGLLGVLLETDLVANYFRLSEQPAGQLLHDVPQPEKQRSAERVPRTGGTLP